jgi:3-methyladenine DNA glycosylase AlkC
MADALKEMFNEKFYLNFAQQLAKSYKKFETKKFVEDVTYSLDERSLNQRLRHTSVVLKKYMPSDFKKSMDIMYDVIENSPRGYSALIFPDFVGLYGHDNFAISMEALKYFTQFGSSEFAIREFLKRDFEKTIRVMEKWATDKNHHVRRLASEGSRPRLPWSFKLDEVINNPKVTQRILEHLKEDKELYVKKSVANHLNDISKDNPDFMLGLIANWDLSNADTKWIVKHANRTLIKKGHEGSLNVFDFEKSVKINVSEIKLNKKKIKLGEQLLFEFDIRSEKNKDQKLVVDYVIHYAKKGGASSTKVFKLKELVLKPKEVLTINKKQLFKDFSTRKHYKGIHSVEILINGKAYSKTDFELLA